MAPAPGEAAEMGVAEIVAVVGGSCRRDGCYRGNRCNGGCCREVYGIFGAVVGMAAVATIGIGATEAMMQ